VTTVSDSESLCSKNIGDFSTEGEIAGLAKLVSLRILVSAKMEVIDR